ncbi:MAG: Stp1/IreP family PP2C-type Ser/Thr phosphatase [Acidobacteria bacterium]|nr:Stp1/IreP family PP2C-type Ser/Thr phosphatase [Acidobacteriota bacterium]
MKLDYAALTDRGRKRKVNEDAYIVNKEVGLLVVADGMGGQVAGEIASQIAVETIERFVIKTEEEREITWPLEYREELSHNQNRLITAIKLAHNRILSIGSEKKGYQGMGTTVVASLLSKGKADIAYVGDSRAYLIRKKKLFQLTSDHSWVNEQLKKGLISPQDAKVHPLRNVVTRALGGKLQLEVDILSSPLKEGDILLLCTDGLNSMLDNEEILKIILANENNLRKAVENLIKKANEKGGEDNITVILARYYKDGEKE